MGMSRDFGEEGFSSAQPLFESVLAFLNRRELCL